MTEATTERRAGERTPGVFRRALEDLGSFFAFLRRNRREVGVTTVATAVLLLFHTRPLAPEPWNSLLYFGLIPLASAPLLGISLRQLGLGIGSVRDWLPLTCLYLAASAPLLWLASRDATITGFYVQRGFDPLASLGSIAVVMLGWEFLFRGYLLFGLKERIGELSILVQMVPFTLAHLNKPEAEALSCIVSGLAWGYICYRGNSYWPAFLMHVAINYTNQALVGLGR